MGAFGWPHLLILLAVILLLFGAAKLPALAKSVGQSARVFKGEMKQMKADDTTAEPTASTAAPPVTPVDTTVRTDTSGSGGTADRPS